MRQIRREGDGQAAARRSRRTAACLRKLIPGGERYLSVTPRRTIDLFSIRAATGPSALAAHFGRFVSLWSQPARPAVVTWRTGPSTTSADSTAAFRRHEYRVDGQTPDLRVVLTGADTRANRSASAAVSTAAVTVPRVRVPTTAARGQLIGVVLGQRRRPIATVASTARTSGPTTRREMTDPNDRSSRISMTVPMPLGAIFCTCSTESPVSSDSSGERGDHCGGVGRSRRAPSCPADPATTTATSPSPRPGNRAHGPRPRPRASC